MILFGIAVVAAGLMGAWHVTKYATPRAMRAIGAKRRSSISSWKADHPAAPPAARWAAAAARTFTGLRWGPGFLWRETKQAWREGFKAGKAKYGLLEPPAPAEAEPQAKQPKCRNDNCFCQDHPDFDGYDPDEPEPLVEEPSARPWPRLVPVSADEPATAQEEKRMTIQTATGGEIVNAEQFHAEAKAIEAEAAADMEDAAADAARAARTWPDRKDGGLADRAAGAAADIRRRRAEGPGRGAGRGCGPAGSRPLTSVSPARRPSRRSPRGTCS
jgi:hypothetical protein